jgi:hypothetical protein
MLLREYYCEHIVIHFTNTKKPRSILDWEHHRIYWILEVTHEPTPKFTSVGISEVN